MLRPRYMFRAQVLGIRVLLMGIITYLLDQIVPGTFWEVWPWIVRHVPQAIWHWFLGQEEGVQTALGAIIVAFIFGTAPNRFAARQERIALSYSYSALASKAFHIILRHVELVNLAYDDAARRAGEHIFDRGSIDDKRECTFAKHVADAGLPRLEPLDALAEAFFVNFGHIGKLRGEAPRNATELFMYLRDLPQANEKLRAKLRDDVGYGKADTYPELVLRWYGDYVSLAFRAAFSAARLLEDLGGTGAERMIEKESKRTGDMSQARFEVQRSEFARRAHREAWLRAASPFGQSRPTNGNGREPGLQEQRAFQTSVKRPAKDDPPASAHEQ